jgi:PAS domain S-box-containing protein
MISTNSDFPFLSGGGKTADLIAIYDWSSTSLGPIATWPQCLKTACSLILRSPVPLVMLWGEDGYMIYNDAYSIFAGGRHPELLGSKVREGWPEVADFNANVMEVGLAGGTLAYCDQELVLYRHGKAEQVWMNLDYSPVLDEEGRPAGVIAIVVETTAKVRAERRLLGESERLRHDVIERKNAEDALRDSETRFRLIADNAPVMLWMGDEVGKCVYLNAAKRKFWNVEEDRIPGFTWEDTVHPEDSEDVGKILGHAMASHEGFTLEARFHNADGAYRLLQTTAQPRFDGNGDFLGMIGVNLDVTEARLAETRRTALIELNDKFRNLDDPAEIAFAAAEILGKALKVSRAGYGTIDPVAETIAIERDWNAPGIASLAGVLHFRDYGTYIEDLKRGETVVFADAEKDPRTIETADRLKAISAQSAVNMPVNEQEGFVAMLYLNHATSREWTEEELAFIREVAERTRTAVERRRAEQALENLAESLEKQVAQRTIELDRVWRNSQDVLVVLDEAGIIRAANPAWTAVLGQATTTITGHALLSFIWSEDRPRAKKLLEDAKRIEGARSFEIRVRHHDGTLRWLVWRISFEDDYIFAYGRDITSEKEKAAALSEAEEQLRQAQKMEAIGQLTGGIAHDFNNLLQVVSGNLQMLGKDVVGNELAERRIDNALAGVNRGARLASQLLAFGRRQPLEPKVVNIGRFVTTMGDMLRRTLGETIEVETVTGGGLWNTFVDPTQIENAILNLAINARDAMNGHGKLTLEVGNAYIDEIYARNHAEVEPGQYVMLAVTDTGTGMSPEIIDRVFEPFFSTKPVGKGTGLGLSMVYGFVKQSGGHVKIYSEVGHGTTIRVYLPRSTQAEDILTDLDQGLASGGTETILVAEDDEDVRATVIDTLSDLGYRVLKAKDAASALSVIESGVPVDLLFTDVVMPGPMRSTELARKAKERLPNIAVLFTSGYTENSIVHGGRLDAGVELISKPYSREALARKVRHLLNNRLQRNLEKKAVPPSMPSTPPSSHPTPSQQDTEDAGGALKILVVEDEVLIRMDLVETLEDMGHKITEAGSGEEAMTLAEESGFDILLTDLGLPRMSGADLAANLREKRADIGVIFATGNNNGPDLSVGAPPVLLRKPYDRVGLQRAIDAAVKK